MAMGFYLLLICAISSLQLTRVAVTMIMTTYSIFLNRTARGALPVGCLKASQTTSRTTRLTCSRQTVFDARENEKPRILPGPNQFPSEYEIEHSGFMSCHPAIVELRNYYSTNKTKKKKKQKD